MNTNQYTQKTLEALQAAQQLAVEYQHNALEPEHLLHALATQEQGLIPQLLQKLNVDAGSFSAAVAEKLSAMPRVSGSGRDPDKVYISQATDKVLSAAAREAKAMKDDYVSVEHVFLALLDEQTQNTSELFRAFSITKDKFLQQLTAVVAVAAVSGRYGVVDVGCIAACRIAVGAAVLISAAVNCLILVGCGVPVISVLVSIRVCSAVCAGTGIGGVCVISCAGSVLRSVFHTVCCTGSIGSRCSVLRRIVFIPLRVVFVFKVSHDLFFLSILNTAVWFSAVVLCFSLSVIIIIRFYVINV